MITFSVKSVTIIICLLSEELSDISVIVLYHFVVRMASACAGLVYSISRLHDVFSSGNDRGSLSCGCSGPFVFFLLKKIVVFFVK